MPLHLMDDVPPSAIYRPATVPARGPRHRDALPRMVRAGDRHERARVDGVDLTADRADVCHRLKVIAREKDAVMALRDARGRSRCGPLIRPSPSTARRIARSG